MGEGKGMLVLSRKLGEKIYIGNDICITVVDMDRGKVRLAIEAPKEIYIMRAELKDQPKKEKEGGTENATN